MTSNKELGLEHFFDISGDFGAKRLAPIQENFPALAEFIMGTVYGDIFKQTTIGEDWKEIVIISALITMSQMDQLSLHYVMALKAGITVEQIKGILLHLTPCVGLPKVINAFNVLLTTLEEIK